MSNVGVPNTQSGKYYFFSSDTSVACWPLSDSFLYFMEFILGLIVHDSFYRSVLICKKKM